MRVVNFQSCDKYNMSRRFLDPKNMNLGKRFRIVRVHCNLTVGCITHAATLCIEQHKNAQFLFTKYL